MAPDTVSAATDFACQPISGRQLLLSQIADGHPLLLLFYDPDCTDCRQELFALRHSSLLRRLTEEESWRVVCVSVGDDEQLWRATAGELPASWTVALLCTDITLLTDYAFDPLPSLYVLDGMLRPLAHSNTLNGLLGTLSPSLYMR